MRDVLPSVLTDRDQWVCWSETYVPDRDEVTKVPYNPVTGTRASSTNPNTWGTFDLAYGLVELGEYDGVGFMFSDEDPIAGVDLDKCRNPDRQDAELWALDIIERLDSYTEISPSGTGYHIFVVGFLPDGRRRRPQERRCESMADWDDPEIEMYDTERFFTVTGNVITQVSTDVEQRNDEITKIHEEFIGGETPDPTPEVNLSEYDGSGDTIYNDLGMPLEVIRKSDEKLDDLLTEIVPAGYGYPSASEADFATAVKMLFWRFNRYTIADALRRYRAREKLTERDNYVEITIESALREIDDDRYMDGMRLLPEEYEMLTSEIDATSPVTHRDLIPTCPICDWVLGEHTLADGDETNRYCTECRTTWTMEEVFLP